MANPAAPADILTMLRSNTTGPVNAAVVAPSVSPPPGVAPMPAVSFEPETGPAIEPAPVYDPAAGFKAAVAAGIEANKPASDQPAPSPQAGAAAPIPAKPVQTAIDAPSFIGSRVRSRTVTLEWPLSYGGKAYEAIVVGRPTTGQLAEYFDRLMAQGEASAALRFPVFFDETGAPIPDALMDALDPDDTDKVMEVVSDFLPVRLRRLQAPQPELSPPPAGGATEPTS
ncbi:hypothetical protein MKK84_14440 [Methylobacterium sp. E-065]|uniref:hypothetical protein n=1 Tax=Methylobacterium sp. E-065 TaxID=2836583 RepID=UPI001FBB1BBC|nr:hypothetical protein [Methylobacterium sp. E-065]MCJ2018621.1 hypothetical protein [Methylobacterium sp. E-065]